MILQRNDFLNLSPTSLKEHYQVIERSRVPKEKNYNVKSYHKVKKNRSQVIYKEFENCEKLNYSIKGKKGTFYKKF